MGVSLRVSVWQPVYRVEEGGKHTLTAISRCSECKRTSKHSASVPPPACPHCGEKDVLVTEIEK